MIYPDQQYPMQQGQQSQYNQAMSPVKTPEMTTYENYLRLLPSLALNEKERGLIISAVSSYMQRQAQTQQSMY